MNGDVQALWARLLLATLADAGVRDVIVSPGSRSTPFLLAALDLAEGADARLRLHDVIDERCAAFFALGRARVTGRPSLLLCTSGTAGANYFPALVEAGQARVPVVALTADRPLELVDCGANQTIDQAKLFGGVARDFVDLGLADPHPSALAGLRRAAARAVAASLFPDPGPVHLNARARKPLEPSGAEGDPSADPDDSIEAMRREVDRLLARPLPRPSRPRVASADDLDALARRLGEVERGLVVAGPAPVEPAEQRGALAERVNALADRLGWPVAADLASQLRAPGSPWADGLEPFWSIASRIEGPELILQLGRGPTSTAWGRWLQGLARDHGIEHWIVSTHGFPDAESTATHHVVADLDVVLDRLSEELDESPRPSADWSRIRAILADARAEVLAEAGWCEAAIARTAVSAVPAGGLLMLGNSMPIRLADVWGGAPAPGVGVLTQRGASGIDGLVSGAAGSASARGEPTLLLLGDVSLRHDLGGLALAARVDTPLVVLVIHNGGGRIFERLPVARHDALPAGGLDHWITPEDGDFEHAAAHFGLDYARVDDLPALREVLSRGLDPDRNPRPILVEARVPPHGAVEVDRALVARLRRELGGGEP